MALHGVRCHKAVREEVFECLLNQVLHSEQPCGPLSAQDGIMKGSVHPRRSQVVQVHVNPCRCIACYISVAPRKEHQQTLL